MDLRYRHLPTNIQLLIGVMSLSLLFVVGCGKPEIKSTSTFQPFHPIQLQADSTVVYLDDFFGTTRSIDSVLWENGKPLLILPDSTSNNGIVVLRNQPLRALGFLQLWSEAQHWEVPVFPTDQQAFTLTLEGYQNAKSIHLMGAMNGWSKSASPMQRIANNWVISMTLPRGEHPYQLIIDGVPQVDPHNPRQVPNGFGAFNSIMVVGQDASEVPLDVSFHAPEKDGSLAFLALQTDPGATVYAFWNSKIHAFVQADSTGYAMVEMPATAFHQLRSHIQIWATNSEARSQEALIPLASGRPILDTKQLTRTDRHAMIMYFLMIDRFANGDPSNDAITEDPGVHPRAQYYGGDIAGIEQAMGYFDSLGVNTIWVSPVTPNPEDAWGYWTDPSTSLTSKFSAYHGYWPIRSSGIDHRFGTMEEFNGWVDVAHENNMNVLIDYVANHVHQNHPVYQKHPDWVTDLYLPDGTMNTQLWDDQRLTTWFDTFMPTLDLERPEVYETMTDSALWWATHSDIDGFRHDATKHIPEVFWRTLTTKIKTTQTDQGDSPLFQIGETYGSPSLINQYVSSGMLDAQFDFNLYDALVVALGKDAPHLEDLIAIAEQSRDTYGAHHVMGNITGNQDRPRFSSLADGGLQFGEDTKLAGWTRDIQHRGLKGYERMSWLMAFLMSTPGIPCIYYGDEIADAGGNDPDNRRMMRFAGWNEAEKTMWNWTRDWITLRTSRMSLMYGQTNYRTPSEGVLEIKRSYLDETTLVFINTSQHDYAFQADPPKELRPLTQNTTAGNGQFIIPAKSCLAFDVLSD
jgi:cyclomaltodextrinase / maltogenic alpha-amylase / neopullulanase